MRFLVMDKLKERKNAQFSIEFIVLIAFMFFIFLGFTAVVITKIIDAQDRERQQIAEDLAQLALNEIVIAKTVSDGYNRTFELPRTVLGNIYTIKIDDNRELVVNYLDKEHVVFLPENIVGDVRSGYNMIWRAGGIVYLESVEPPAECEDGLDNDGDGFCDTLSSTCTDGSLPGDTGCVNEADIEESDCGDGVCEGGENPFTCLADCPISISIFRAKNAADDAITFEENGNVILKGGLLQEATPNPSSDDDFIIKNETGKLVASVNLVTGDMIISGKLYENQDLLSPTVTRDDFIVKDASGNVVSYIDDKGDFFLKGVLIRGTITPGSGTRIFIFQDAGGVNAASFDFNGDLILKGTLEEATSYTATGSDEFRFQDSVGNDVAIIDLITGNMFIDGTLSETLDPIPPSASDFDFAIEDSSGKLIALIKENGDLLLAGNLLQNDEP
jgi:hypothetical protein